MKKGVLSCDLGASSGRIIFVSIKNHELLVEEIYRYKNEPMQIEKGLFWNFEEIFSEIKTGVKKTIEKGYEILSLGIDTWGVDYGWIDKEGNLVQNPYCYRDNRVDSIIDEVHKIVGEKELYKKTGNSFYKFNTVYQLYADLEKDEKIKKNGDKVLFTPNLVGYYLTGKMVNEYSIASTSGLINQSERNFSKELLEKLKIPKDIFPKLVEAGTILGNIKNDLAEEFNCKPFPVINVNCHDSASAVNYSNNFQSGKLFLINGTWSLIGCLNDMPINSDEAYKYKISNEGQGNLKNRVIRLIPGTWILQRLKLDFEKMGKNYSYGEFGNLAKSSNENLFIDLEKEELIFPDSMLETVKKFLPIKEYKDADIIKIAYNSILKKYGDCIKILEKITGNKIEKIYAIGGGIQDDYLISSIRKEVNIELELGVIEASTIGNARTQLFTLGLVKDDSEWNELILNYLVKENGVKK
ncbi:MAG: rhamnulokinase [Fusobacteriaceae bacterium]